MLSAASSSSLVTLRERERARVSESERCRRGAKWAGRSAQLDGVRLMQRRAERRCGPRDADGVGSESALRPRHADRTDRAVTQACFAGTRPAGRVARCPGTIVPRDTETVLDKSRVTSCSGDLGSRLLFSLQLSGVEAKQVAVSAFLCAGVRSQVRSRASISVALTNQSRR